MRSSIIVLVMLGMLAAITTQADERASIPLAGTWKFRIDPDRVGEAQKWFEQDFTDVINLPGSTDQAGYGQRVTQFEKHFLTRQFKYEGHAWYEMEINVPQAWRGKWVRLFMERVHWQSDAWLDGKHIGMRDSLVAPHEYDLGSVEPGRHRLVVRVDNTYRYKVGKDAHSFTEHTQTNWNGIVGKIELRATDPVWIDSVKVTSDTASGNVRLDAVVRNMSGKGFKGLIHGKAVSPDGKEQILAGNRFEAIGPQIEMSLMAAPPNTRLWDEFDPALGRAELMLEGSIGDEKIIDRIETSFAVRNVATKGTQITINGRPIMLRGTLECCIFPRTGYPATDVESWAKICRVLKAHGMNHLRFHSHCPPEAAFIAADEAGIYLHVETPVWTALGDDPRTDAFIHAEAERIVKAYGNHPSFIGLSVGNEPSGAKQKEFLSGFVNKWKAADPRRLYTGTSGWPNIPEEQYQVLVGPRLYMWGDGLKGAFNATQPKTDYDYANWVAKRPYPIVSHEVGQWCVYPNFREIEKYDGHLKPRNFDIFRDTLGRNHMLDQADAFVMASGKLQTLLYKEEVEASLRTANFGGFQLLDLHDFPGQGTALVGMLDPFWDSKPYLTPAEFKRFCDTTVTLAKMAKFTWKSSETFSAELMLSHYGPKPIDAASLEWKLTSTGSLLASGKTAVQDVPTGNVKSFGKIEASLVKVTKPAKCVLSVSLPIAGKENSWDIWVYPDAPAADVPVGVVLTTEWNASAKAALDDGKTVLFLPARGNVGGNVAAGFTAMFWNSAWTKGMPPVTLGILCDPKHPALAKFPTDYHSNYQWWELAVSGPPMVLDKMPAGLRPIVQVIDDWVTNRRLGLVFEARVSKGHLLVCSVDISSDLDKRVVAKQLRRSLLDYAASGNFAPCEKLDFKQVESLLVRPLPTVDAPPAEKAMLHVKAADKLTVQKKNVPWKSDMDVVVKQMAGFAYRIQGDGTWRDENGPSWHGNRLHILIDCPKAFEGTLYVRYHDFGSQKRTGQITLGATSFALGAHAKAMWAAIPVSREDSANGSLDLESSTVSGPNLHVTEMMLVPKP